MKYFALFCSAIAFTVPALAEPFTYGPEQCEFQITFPEKPFIETKCSATGKDCAEVVSYTKAVGADSSTNFRVTCNPVNEAENKQYTVDVIKETLNQLTKNNNLEPYDTQSNDSEGYRSASTISLSERDGKPLIYSAQIWIGKKSMFTIESEILGSKNAQIEKTFADILSKTYPKDQPPKPKKQAASTETKK